MRDAWRVASSSPKWTARRCGIDEFLDIRGVCILSERVFAVVHSSADLGGFPLKGGSIRYFHSLIGVVFGQAAELASRRLWRPCLRRLSLPRGYGLLIPVSEVDI